MFKRKYNILLQPLVWAKYRSIINVDNIETLSSKKINKIFEKEDQKAREWYLHQIISQWFARQQDKELSLSVLDRIKKLIKKLKLEINEMEKHDLLIIEERIFSSERTLKVLDTHHKLKLGEQVNAIFQKCNLFSYEEKQFNIKLTKHKQIWTQKEYLKIMKTGILLISNKRLIIESKDSVENIYFKNIISYIHTEEGFEFIMNRQRYLLKIHDQETLNQTIDLILRKKAKNVIKKCKNN